jgi:hypothetical protein
MLSHSSRRYRAYDEQRATLKPKQSVSSQDSSSMPSSKGEPTDPELREKIKEEVKAEEKGTSKLLINLACSADLFGTTAV